MFDQPGWFIVALAWLACSFGAGALLAVFYKRLHPTLSFHKLWAFWAVLSSVLAAILLSTGLV